MCAQYVTHGAKLKCNCGSKIANLQVLPDRTVILTDGHYANISDHQSLVNIPSFGLCRSYKYPPTKSATDAHNGSLTPMPCKPGTYSLWQEGNDSYIIRHFPALLTSSYCRCVYGGVITIVTDGQIPNNYEIPIEVTLQKEDIDLAEEDEDKDEERGLDAIDFIPVVGSIRDIADGIKSGDKGLIAFGVVFLVADVAGIIGSVFSGGAASVGVAAAKSTAKAGLKAAAKTAAKETTKQAAKQGEKKLLEVTAREATKQAAKEGEKKLLEITAREATQQAAKQGEKKLLEITAREATQQAAKEGEKKLLEITARGASEGGIKLAEEVVEELAEGVAEKAAKGLNPFDPKFINGVTKIAEKGAPEVVKSPKAVSLLDDAFKFIEKSSKGTLETGLKQLDEIGKAGKEWLKAGGRAIKRRVEQAIKDNTRILDDIEKIQTEMPKVQRQYEALLKEMGRL